MTDVKVYKCILHYGLYLYVPHGWRLKAVYVFCIRESKRMESIFRVSHIVGGQRLYVFYIRDSKKMDAIPYFPHGWRLKAVAGCMYSIVLDTCYHPFLSVGG